MLKLKASHYTTVDKKYEELYNWIYPNVNDAPLEGDTFNKVAGMFASAIRKPKESPVPDDGTGPSFKTGDIRLLIQEMLKPYYGQPFTRPMLEHLCWRVAAGETSLQSFIPLLKDFVPGHSYWTPLRIDDVRYTVPTKRGFPALALTFRIYWGPFAGLSFSQKIAESWVRHKLRGDIGFPKYHPVHPRELTLAMVLGLIETPEGRPSLMEVHPEHSSIVSSNRKLRKLRAEACPRDYTHPCHKCPVGYGVDPHKHACPRATHYYSYVLRTCARCKQESFFDPGARVPFCLSCQARQNYMRAMATS